MTVIIKRPRRVAREALEEPTNTQYLSSMAMQKVAEILAKDDDDWTKGEFAYCMSKLAQIDDAQNGD